MTIQRRATIKTPRSTGTTGNYTVSVGSTGDVESHDLMLLHLTLSDDTVGITLPSGWTAVQTVGATHSVRVYQKRAGAESSFNISRSGSVWIEAVITSWYDTTGDFAAVDDSANQSNASGDYDWPSVDPTDSPGVLLCFGTLNTDVTLTSPSGMTEVYEYKGGVAADPTLYLCQLALTTALPTGTKSATLDTGTANTSNAVSLNLVTVVAERTVACRLWVDWDFNGTYTDEGGNVIRIQGEMSIAPPGASITASQGIISRATVTLHNKDARYSSLRTDGALYSDIQSGLAYHAPCYVEISTDDSATFTSVFTGVLKIPAESSLTVQAGPTATFEMRSNEEKLLNKRLSTTAAEVQANHIAGGKTEAELMADFLQDVGLSASDYTLDPGMFVLPLVWLDDESVIEVCWRLASAAGGRFYADPDGKFVYENAQHWLSGGHETSSLTLTPSNWQTMAPSYSDNELYKESEVVATVYGIGTSTTLWEPREIISVPPNTTKAVTARLNTPAFEIESVDWTATTPGGNDITSDVALTKTEYAKRVELSFASTSSQTAYIANLKITGRPILTENEASRTATSAASFWTDRTGRKRRISNNKFVQTVPQAEAIADFLKDRQQSPSLFITARGSSGKPSLRLGDRVTVSDSNTMSSDMDIILTRIEWQFSKDGFNQSLTGVEAAGLYTYNPTQYFVIGTSRLGSTGSDIGRLFY